MSNIFIKASGSSRTVLPHLKILNNDLNIILASGSPRRKELINLIGINNFQVIVSKFAEDLDKSVFSNPVSYCAETAKKKLEFTVSDIKASYPNLLNKPMIVIAADTVVVVDNTILEKPKDVDDSVRMLSMLNGRSHLVHTAVSIYADKNVDACDIDSNFSVPSIVSFVETTKVKFSQLTTSDILSYAESKEGLDKAGSYGIQGLGGQLVEGIEGCYFNVMGLPIQILSSELADIVEKLS